MRVSVHYYAAAKELAGCESSTFEFAGRHRPAGRAAQRRHRSISFAGGLPRAHAPRVNGDFVDASRPLHDGDRVDVLPPVAGGSPIVLCQISEREISLDEVRKAVEHPGAGGICIFHGVVRDHADGKQVARLDYEAHESLAHKEMKRVLEGVAAEHCGRPDRRGPSSRKARRWGRCSLRRGERSTSRRRFHRVPQSDRSNQRDRAALEEGVGPRWRRPLGEPRRLGPREAAHVREQRVVQHTHARQVGALRVEVALHRTLDVVGVTLATCSAIVPMRSGTPNSALLPTK